MRGAHKTPTVTTARPSAVAWVDERHAIVARSIAERRRRVGARGDGRRGPHRRDLPRPGRRRDRRPGPPRDPRTERRPASRSSASTSRSTTGRTGCSTSSPRVLGRDALVERLRSIRA